MILLDDVKVSAAAISELCLGAACVLAVGALGGAATFALLPWSLLSVAAAFFAFLAARSEGNGLPVPRLALVFVVATALCLLQLIPLPLPLLQVASPEAAELVRFNLEPLGLSTVRPISVDAPSTARELIKAVGYAALVVAAAYLARSRSVRRRLHYVVAALGAVVALIGAVHALLGAEELFGLYRFSSPPPVITPFGNPNHLAGFLILSATLTLGLFVDARGGAVRLMLGLAYLAQAAVCMFSTSRAGIVFFLLAQLLLAALAFRSRKSTNELVPPRVLAAGAAICALAVGAYAAWDRLTAEYEQTASVAGVRESKVSLWPDFARGAAAYSRLGMGRGAFELGYARHHPRPSFYSYTHPENELLQLWAELGLPGCVALLGIALWAFASLFRRGALSTVDYGIVAAVSAVALHNLFDFSLELLAVPTVACVVLGTVSRREEQGQLFLLQRARGAAVLAGSALLVLAAAHVGRSHYRRAESDLVILADAKATEATALPLINRHPADGLLYTAVGLAYSADPKADQRTALAWLNRGLYLAPWDGAAHRAVARALLRLGRRQQAFGEYRLALESHAAVLDNDVVVEITRAAKTADELARAAPAHPGLVERLAAIAGERHPPLTLIAFLDQAIPRVEDARGRVPLLVRLAGLQRAVQDFEGAMKTLDAAQQLDPNDASVAIGRAGVLDSLGRAEQAMALLESQLTKYPGDFRLHLELIQRAADPNKALTAIGRARAFADSAAQQYEVFAAEARVYARLERYARAVQSAETAARLAPKNPQAHYFVADLYAKLGRFADARRALKDGMNVDSAAGAKLAESSRRRSWEAEEKRINELREKALLQEAGP